jgi:hypothetical protein
MRFGRMARSRIVPDVRQQGQQQIEAAMDIADRIDPLADRDLRTLGFAATRRQRIHALQPAAIADPADPFIRGFAIRHACVSIASISNEATGSVLSIDVRNMAPHHANSNDSREKARNMVN